MGIKGLLPVVSDVVMPMTLEHWSGHRVAVDAFAWLHRGAHACSEELVLGIPTDKHLKYFMKRVDLLRSFKIEPIIVFDGCSLPSKLGTNAERKSSRESNKKKGIHLKAEGRFGEARRCFASAVEITQKDVQMLQHILNLENVFFIVAPYEADAQLAYLSREGLVDLVLTEDSDLLAFGSCCVGYKMTEDATGASIQVIDGSTLTSKSAIFNGMSQEEITISCILAGCDYLPSLKGIGIQKAVKHVRRFAIPNGDVTLSIRRIIQGFMAEGVTIPVNYELDLIRALRTFKFQAVADPRRLSPQDTSHPWCPLRNKPEEFSTMTPEENALIGSIIEDATVAKGISRGFLNPKTLEPLIEDSNKAQQSSIAQEKEDGGGVVAVRKESVRVESTNTGYKPFLDPFGRTIPPPRVTGIVRTGLSANSIANYFGSTKNNTGNTMVSSTRDLLKPHVSDTASAPPPRTVMIRTSAVARTSVNYSSKLSNELPAAFAIVSDPDPSGSPENPQPSAIRERSQSPLPSPANVLEGIIRNSQPSSAAASPLLSSQFQPPRPLPLASPPPQQVKTPSASNTRSISRFFSQSTTPLHNLDLIRPLTPLSLPPRAANSASVWGMSKSSKPANIVSLMDDCEPAGGREASTAGGNEFQFDCASAHSVRTSVRILKSSPTPPPVSGFAAAALQLDDLAASPSCDPRSLTLDVRARIQQNRIIDRSHILNFPHAPSSSRAKTKVESHVSEAIEDANFSFDDFAAEPLLNNKKRQRHIK